MKFVTEKHIQSYDQIVRSLTYVRKRDSSSSSLQSKLLSLVDLLCSLGWEVAWRDPKDHEKFHLSSHQKSNKSSSISKSQIRKILLETDPNQLLYKSDQLIVWHDSFYESDSKQTILSKREKEVYHLLLAGQKLTVIAGELGISKRTAEKHVENVYKKMRVSSFNQLLFGKKGGSQCV